MMSVVVKVLSVVRVAALLGVVAFAAMPAPSRADTGSCKLPVHTSVAFHLTAAASSNQSKTGQSFGFVLLKPIDAPGCAIPADGSVGAGTIVLAGPSGNLGHEGDLTLRLDTLRTANGLLVTFDDQEVKLNGADRKTESTILRLVPDAGVGAIFIHGQNVALTPDTPLETELMWPATVTDGGPAGSKS